MDCIFPKILLYSFEMMNFGKIFPKSSCCFGQPVDTTFHFIFYIAVLCLYVYVIDMEIICAYYSTYEGVFTLAITMRVAIGRIFESER